MGIFYKNSLPFTPRPDLSFSESIVFGQKFGRRKFFFTVLYCSPSKLVNSHEFADFKSNLNNLHGRMNTENPFATFYTGDFNGHSKCWWKMASQSRRVKKLKSFFTSLNLSQVISDPTNFHPGKRPSCIDLIVTDQPNLVLDSRTRRSLDSKCHHQIIYSKINLRIPPPPPPFERPLWHFDNAKVDLNQRSIKQFPWQHHHSLNSNPNWRVKTFRDVLLNIKNNSIPKSVKRYISCDPPLDY